MANPDVTPLVEAVIFDVDGTLIDSNDLHARAWEEAFRRVLGRTVPAADIRPHIGKGGDQLLPEFLSPEEVKNHGEELSAARKEIVLREMVPRMRAFPETRELFADLRARGVRIALASSATGEELERYKEIARVGDLLDEQTTTDDASRSKPDPDIFHAVLGRLANVPPGCALVVGDTPYDADAARKAGLKTVAVRCGGFPEADLRRAGAMTVYQDPADLRRHLVEAFRLRAATGPTAG